jgi:hypothetical protein
MTCVLYLVIPITASFAAMHSSLKTRTAQKSADEAIGFAAELPGEQSHVALSPWRKKTAE